MQTYVFNYTDALHSDDFTLFTSAKVVLDRRPHNTLSKSNAPCVLLSLMSMYSFLNGCCLVGVCFLGFVHSSSSLLVLYSHLSPTALNSNPPYWKMADFRKALDAKLKLIGLKTFLANQDRPYTSASEICKCQRTTTPSTLNDWLC